MADEFSNISRVWNIGTVLREIWPYLIAIVINLSGIVLMFYAEYHEQRLD